MNARIAKGKAMQEYDVYHFGVSGGKDSTALLLWAVNESGYPLEKIRATFSDTGNEHQFTYDYIAMLSERVFPIETIKPPLDFYELVKKKGRFPAAKARFCTQQLKIYPAQAYILEMQRGGAKVLLHSGVRAGESEDRAAMPEREWDEYYAADVYRPLLRWSKDGVFAYLAKHGIPRNPLYDYGAERVGCFPCIMSRKAEIRVIAKNFPERIDMIREAEQGMENGNMYSSFFARDKVPAHFRSKTIITASGEEMQVATIDDVVQWSMTGHRKARQYELDLDGPVLCNSNLGMCE